MSSCRWVYSTSPYYLSETEGVLGYFSVGHNSVLARAGLLEVLSFLLLLMRGLRGFSLGFIQKQCVERENVSSSANILEWGEREDCFGAQQGRSAESLACLVSKTLDLGLPL